MCIVEEVKRCKTCFTGCGFDWKRIWTNEVVAYKDQPVDGSLVLSDYDWDYTYPPPLSLNETNETSVNITQDGDDEEEAADDSKSVIPSMCNFWGNRNAMVFEGNFGGSLLHKNMECRSKEIKLGNTKNMIECAERCVEKDGCEFFIYGKNDEKGNCFMELTKRRDCPEGLIETSDYDF